MLRQLAQRWSMDDLKWSFHASCGISMVAELLVTIISILKCSW